MRRFASGESVVVVDAGAAGGRGGGAPAAAAAAPPGGEQRGATVALLQRVLEQYWSFEAFATVMLAQLRNKRALEEGGHEDQLQRARARSEAEEERRRREVSAVGVRHPQRQQQPLLWSHNRRKATQKGAM